MYSSYNDFIMRYSKGEPVYKKRNLYIIDYGHFQRKAFTSKKVALQFCEQNNLHHMAVYKLYECGKEMDLYKLAQVETFLSF